MPEKFHLPTAEARKLNELASEKWQEHLLLFSQVKNKVLFVNPEIFAPLKLKEGEPSPLGLFVEAAFQKKPTETPKDKQAMEIWPQHTRSAMLGRIFFADKKGVIYRDIDIKGVGYFGLDSGEKAKVAGLGKPYGWTIGGYILPEKSFLGIFNEDYAFFDYQMSEAFLKKGIRTTRTIAIIKLEEIISSGSKITIDEAKKQKFIEKGMTPVIEIRAFATKFRIADLTIRDDQTKKINNRGC